MRDQVVLTEKAKVFATAAHAAIGQTRKYTGEPYIVHPIEVANLLLQYVPDVTDEQLAAAYLHDVLEDTQVTENVLRAQFGDEVTDLVVWLTNKSKKTDGPRAVRKKIDRQHLAKAPAEAQTIKLADLLANTDSIVDHDKDFARVYLPEKKALLEVLTLGNRVLWNKAFMQLAEAEAALVQDALREAEGK